MSKPVCRFVKSGSFRNIGPGYGHMRPDTTEGPFRLVRAQRAQIAAKARLGLSFSAATAGKRRGYGTEKCVLHFVERVFPPHLLDRVTTSSKASSRSLLSHPASRTAEASGA